MKTLRLETPRLTIVPYDHSYLQDYFTEFTDEITNYQYPDTFANVESARELVSYFVELMEQGKMLALVILSKTGEFLGSMEVHGVTEPHPELGLWLKTSAHGHGYGYGALKCLVDYLNTAGQYDGYLYETDKRNLPSIRLVQKFQYEEASYNDITTESGKQLFLVGYIIRG